MPARERSYALEEGEATDPHQALTPFRHWDSTVPGTPRIAGNPRLSRPSLARGAPRKSLQNDHYCGAGSLHPTQEVAGSSPLAPLRRRPRKCGVFVVQGLGLNRRLSATFQALLLRVGPEFACCRFLRRPRPGWAFGINSREATSHDARLQRHPARRPPSQPVCTTIPRRALSTPPVTPENMIRASR